MNSNEIITPQHKEDIKSCARIYCSAYSTEPWNEIYEEAAVEKYITAYLNSDTKRCFALVDNGQITGLALGLIIPCIPDPYFRIEDFCIDAEIQRTGCGSIFLKLLSEKLKELGCDSILLGTQRDFPSHRFYLKNGFEEIESVFLYRELT